jgi:hypothetical protein
MPEKARSFFKDVLLVGGVFAVLSGAYAGFAYAERYRALTGAYIVQSEKIIGFLHQHAPRVQELTGE